VGFQFLHRERDRERPRKKLAVIFVSQSLYCVALVSFKWREVRARACAQEALFVRPSVRHYIVFGVEVSSESVRVERLA